MRALDDGTVCRLAQRDGSAQRRRRTLITEESSGALAVDLVIRDRQAAVDRASALNQVGAMTAEFASKMN